MKKLLWLFALLAFTTCARAQFADQRQYAATSGGTANAQTVAIANYALNPGVVVRFKAGATNTGAATLAVNGTTPKALRVIGPTGLLALTGSEIVSGQVTEVLYDGTQYEILNPAAGAGFSTYLASGLATALPNLTTSQLYGGSGGAGVAQAFPLGTNISSALQVALNAANGLAGLDASGYLKAAQVPPLTGDVTTPGGSLATTIVANAVTNAKAAQMVANSVKCNPTSSTANASDCTSLPAFVTVPSQQISVKQYGALGNSNGTTGNGNDDTSAIATALSSAPNGDVFVPCGTYRITANIVNNTAGANYHLHGAGRCSQIYLDAGTAITAFTFSTASGCSACLEVDNLAFIAPTSAGATALGLGNENSAKIHDNFILDGYGLFVYLTTSYAPKIERNWGHGLASGLIGTAGDASLNGAKIWDNTLLSTTNTAINLNCGNAENISLLGNDLEGNATGLYFTNCNSVDLSDNYIETNSVANFAFAPGSTNVGYTIRNNLLGTSAATTLGPVQGVNFGGNTVNAWAISWASTALGVNIEPTNLVQSGGSIGALPVPTVSSCGTSPSAATGTRASGQVTEGTSATGCVVAFELAYRVAPRCTVNLSTGVAVGVSAMATTGFTVVHSSVSSNNLYWICTGQ